MHHFFINIRVNQPVFLLQVENRHIYPAEIESTILSAFSSDGRVTDVGVFGVSDALTQERVAALVVKGLGKGITEEEVAAAVRERLDPFKWLTGGVTFVPRLPRNPQGKVLRNRFQAMAEEYAGKK